MKPVLSAHARCFVMPLRRSTAPTFENVQARRTFSVVVASAEGSPVVVREVPEVEADLNRSTATVNYTGRRP